MKFDYLIVTLELLFYIHYVAPLELIIYFNLIIYRHAVPTGLFKPSITKRFNQKIILK